MDQIQKKLFHILKSKNDSLREKFPEYTSEFNPENFPVNIRKLYPGYSSYTLELGSGWGEFAIAYARNFPDTFYLALDKKRYRILKSLKTHSAENRLKNPVKNLRWMVCNFDWYFEGMFQKNSFDKVIINFPDPWPKKKHAKHRFIKIGFIKNLHDILTDTGIVEFATDNWNYMENAQTDFNISKMFKNINGDNIILNKIENRPQSYFEELKREEKENIYFIQLLKLS